MRTRQASKQQRHHSSGNENENFLGSKNENGTLAETSREGVGKLVQRVKGRKKSRLRIDEKEEADKRVTWNDVDAAGCSGDTIGQEASRDVDGGRIQDNGQEMDDELDWEDGSIPVENVTDNHPERCIKGVTVEFETADSDDSVRPKPTRRASAEDKEVAELVHKVHLLCLLARGRMVDQACDDLLIQASLLSLMPKHLLKISEVSQLKVKDLYHIVKWFHDNFNVRNSASTGKSFHSALASAIEHREGSPEEIAALSVALFRSLKLTTRFVSILDVASLKPEAEKTESPSRDGGLARGIFSTPTLMVTRPKEFSTSPIEPLSSNKKENACEASSSSSSKRKNRNSTNNCTQPKSSPLDDKLNARKSASSSSEACHDTSNICLNKEPQGVKRKGIGDLEFEMQLEMALSSTAVGTHKKNRASSNVSPPVERKQISSVETSTSTSNQGISTVVGSRKVGSPLYWAEVYCSAENLTGRWVHVDAANGIIDGEQKVEAAAAACKTFLRYVVAFAGCGAKDVTRRYCMKWYKIASKRVDSVWWDAVLAPLRELESGATESTHDGLRYPGNSGSDIQSSVKSSSVASRSSLEDMELETRALTEPLPTNQQAYRSHKLYAIERWLNKHQIIYPKDPILGFCSGHPVYPRTCVQTLKTKERWLHEALQVKANEQPVKVIKNTSKLKKVQISEVEDCEEVDSKGNIELYGKWQLEPLCLPHAVNGIVPKNERGQVDVWSEKCLPHGTVHIRLPRVFSVAKRLEIDYAPAMVGFEFRSGRATPVYDGIVVCTEFKDVITEAYAEEEGRRKAEEKKRREAQALSRWYQLLSSIVTRQKLNNCYGDGSSSQMSTGIQHMKNDKQNVPGSSLLDPRQSQESSKVDTQDVKRYAPSMMETEDHEHLYLEEDMSYDEESCVRTKRCHCGFSIQVEEL